MSIVFENVLLQHLVISSLFLLLLFLLPLLILIALLLISTRLLVTLYKNLVLNHKNNDYGDLLSGMNNFFSGESPYSSNPPPLATVVGHCFLDNNLTAKEMQVELQRHLDNFSNSGSGSKSGSDSIIFPELKQYVTTLLGFSIFRNEKNFKIEDHAKDLKEIDPSFENKVIDEENVANVCFKLSRVPFKRGKSPWEFLIHSNPNSLPVPSVMILRFHHTVGDALAITRFLGHVCNRPNFFEDFIQKFKNNEKAVKKKRSLGEKVWYGISFPVLGIYEVASVIIKSWDDNALHKGRAAKIRSDYIYTNFEPIEKIRVKKLREKFGNIKFYTVVLAAFTGGLRRFMKKKGIEIPKEIHAVISIPVPKNANRLSNNITNSIMTIPTGEEDKGKVIRILERESNNSKTSRYALMMLIVSSFLGLFPQKLLVNFWIFTTMATSNFPGFDEPIFFANRRMLNISAVATMPCATTGIYFWSSGYTDKLFLTLGLSTDIVNSMDDMKEIRSLILQEFDALEKMP